MQFISNVIRSFVSHGLYVWLYETIEDGFMRSSRRGGHFDAGDKTAFCHQRYLFWVQTAIEKFLLGSLAQRLLALQFISLFDQSRT